MSEIFGAHVSGTRTRNVYGGLPYQLAGGLGGQIQGLESAFGFGPANARQGHRLDQLLSRGGPLAAFANEVRGFAPGVIPEAEAAGQQVATRGSEAFQNLTQQIAQAQGYANTFGREAFDPALETPFYREAFRRAVEPERGAAAARGLLESGPGQVGEDALARDLTTGFSQQQLGMQQAVPGLLTAPAQAGLEAVPQLAQSLSAQFGIPLQAAGGLLQLLTSQQSPAMQLLGLTQPVQAPFSGKQGLGGVGKTG